MSSNKYISLDGERNSFFERLSVYIKKKKLFDRDYLLSLEIDKILDLRNNDDFSENWMRIYNELQTYKLEEERKNEITEIIKEIFLLVYEITNDGELAGEISDDFELICIAYNFGFEDVWLSSMVNIYANKKIPYGILKNKSESLKTEFLRIK